MSQLPTYTQGIPEDSRHYGHLISYNERAILCRKVVVIEDGFVRPDPSDPGEVEAISESFLYCETCDVRIAGDEVGADDWEVA